MVESILLKFCRPVDRPDYAAGTARTNLDNSLSFLMKTVPGFIDIVRGKSVLDFGCGYGWQATALARSYDAEVTGLDLDRPELIASWDRIRKEYALPNLVLTADLPASQQFDVIMSCGSFEHFSDPEGILALMRERLKPGGKIVITFAEPWYSNNGAHMGGFCRLPWVNLLFPESTVLRVRSRYRTDGAKRYEEIEGGLNRMTVSRFERIIRSSGLHVEWMQLWPTLGLPLVTHIPVARELLTSACSSILTKPEMVPEARS